MNRFVTLLALAIGVSGPASAGVIKVNPNVVAGQVSALGVIERGSGFRVHLNGFTYEIKFDRHYFPSGCVAMVVTSVGGPVIPNATQDGQCGGPLYVTFYGVNERLTTSEFQFIAREDAPQNT